MKYLFMLFISVPAIAGSLNIPMDKSGWTELQFSKIVPNHVSYSASGIQVVVNSSASPLVYKLNPMVTVSAFEANLNIHGTMEDSAGFEEDSYFRLGIVATGENTLSKMSSWFAPTWVKQLFALAPKGVGLDKIYFFNVVKSTKILGKERQHPDSKYLYERAVAAKEQDATHLRFQLREPLKAAALWISIDGDNTKSKFTTEIQSIKLETL